MNPNGSLEASGSIVASFMMLGGWKRPVATLYARAAGFLVRRLSTWWEAVCLQTQDVMEKAGRSYAQEAWTKTV